MIKPDEGTALLLERTYRAFHHPSFIQTDPLSVVRSYRDPEDCELAALVSAALALGLSSLIGKAARQVLGFLGQRPAYSLDGCGEATLRSETKRLKYRFFEGSDFAALLVAIKRARSEYGSLRNLFLASDRADEPTIIPAMTGFIRKLRQLAGSGLKPMLLPSPENGSACKRPFLFLRWLVRHDAIDPGGWESVGRHRLVVPLDVHMSNACRRLGFLNTASVDLKAALRATEAFKLYDPADPLRFDFSLTRLGVTKALSSLQP